MIDGVVECEEPIGEDRRWIDLVGGAGVGVSLLARDGPVGIEHGDAVEGNRCDDDLLTHMGELTSGNIVAPCVVGPFMRHEVKAALDQGGIADITTIGRRSGKARRIEIYFHHFDGEYFLLGRPGRRRDWVANIEANPRFTLHLKRGVSEDIAVIGEPEPDKAVRRKILLRALIENWDSDPDRAEAAVDRWVLESPFIGFRVAEPAEGS